MEYMVYTGKSSNEREITRWQAATLEKFAREKNITAFAVAPLNYQETLQPLRKVTSTGIACVTFDTDSPDSGRQFFVGTNNYLAGTTCAYKLAQLVDFQGRVAIHTPTLSTFSCIERIRGFLDSIKRYNKIEVVKTETGEESAEKLLMSARRCFKDYPDIVGIFAAAGTSGKVCAQAAMEAGAYERVKIVCFDIDRDLASRLRQGVINLIVAQRPYTIGYRTADYLYRISKEGIERVLRGVPASRIVDTGIQIISDKNLNEYRESQKKLGIPVDF
ncbi:MAG: substrate-binding domain-containing protein, partial [bacterium]